MASNLVVEDQVVLHPSQSFSMETTNMKIIRKLGVGDVQHVRTQLLNVGILSPQNQEIQLEGACEAGTYLNMMMRAQVMPPCNEQLLLEVMYRHLDHQILTYETLGKDQFVSVFETLDVIIEPEPGEIFSVNNIRDGIIETWNAHGGRFIGGNFKRASYEELQQAYPSYAVSANPYWQQHIDHFKKA